jgi:hypothetical protein
MATSVQHEATPRETSRGLRVVACELAIELEAVLIRENQRDNEIIVNLVNRINGRKAKIEAARAMATDLDRSGRAA